MKYNRCSRCDINYVEEGEEHCKICKKELKGIFTDDDINIEENICPYCEKNKLDFGEEMCHFCSNKKYLKDKKDKIN